MRLVKVINYIWSYENMAEVIMFSCFVFFILFFLISNVFRNLKLLDYIISACLSFLFSVFFYDSFPKSMALFLSCIGPLLFLKIILDDFFIISYKEKYYRNMLYHILGFFLMSLFFYSLVLLSEKTPLFYTTFLLSIFFCIFYCFYFVFGYRKMDEIFQLQKKHKVKKVLEYAHHSNNHKDNLSTLPLHIDVIQKAEEDSYDSSYDMKMKNFEQSINEKRNEILKNHIKHAVKR
jgi:hypothetical protein